VLPEGATPVITGRDFVIANIAAPSSLKSSGSDDAGETEEAAEAEE
jgi:large subunit ribosomal protein L25